jgi:AbrB family looped-hinge helix DNA binding protein
MRITSKGQVTIPAEIRERLGLLPQTEVSFEVDDTTVRIVRQESQEEGRGQLLVERMKGKTTSRLSTEELMALTRGEPGTPRRNTGRRGGNP